MLLAALLAGMPTVAAAQTAAATSPPASAVAPDRAASTADLQALYQTLESGPERQQFLSRLKALIAARQQLAPSAPSTPGGLGTDVITGLSARIQATSEALVGAGGAILSLPDPTAWLLRQAAEPDLRDAWLALLAKLAIVLGAAWLADRIVRLLTRGPRRALQRSNGGGSLMRALAIAAHLVVDLLPVAAFAVAGFVALTFTRPGGSAQLILLGFIDAVTLLRAILVAARLLLTPPAAGLRLLAVDDETASYWLVWARRLLGLTVMGTLALDSARLVGLPASLAGPALRVLWLAVLGLAVVLILQNRRAVANRIRGRRAGRRHGPLSLLRSRLADTWHVLAVAYATAVYVTWALGVAGGFELILRSSLLSAAVLVAARLASHGVRWMLRRLFAVTVGLKDHFPLLEARANRYLPVLVRAASVLIYLVAFVFLLEIWGLGGLGWAQSRVGQWLLSGTAAVAGIALIAILVWEATTIVIDLYLARRAAGTSAAQRRHRAETLLPLLRRTVSIVVVVLAVLMALSALGVNIAPLLAGAGVVGIAVGLGAQGLIKDLITGLFIIMEDTVAVGDVVDLGGNAGVVEGISLRTIRLRDLKGTVHSVPYGDITRVQNLTKDFSFALFEVGVAYREDVDQVIAVLKEIGAGLQADPAFAPLILEPIEVLGLDRFADSAVIVTARMKTRPIQQWTVMREFNRRLKRRFDELGIAIPFPHRTLHFDDDRGGTALPVRVNATPAPNPGQAPGR